MMKRVFGKHWEDRLKAQKLEQNIKPIDLKQQLIFGNL